MSFYTEINNKTAKCPYCGTNHKNIEMIRSDLVEKDGYQVRCKNCGARGPEYNEPAMAIEYWNEVAATYNWEVA